MSKLYILESRNVCQAKVDRYVNYKFTKRKVVNNYMQRCLQRAELLGVNIDKEV